MDVLTSKKYTSLILCIGPPGVQLGFRHDPPKVAGLPEAGTGRIDGKVEGVL